MRAFRTFKGEHGDFIHDVAYDYYGKRLATCSSDNSIKVWDQGPDGEWACSALLPKAHSGSVYRLSWAHPEFGQLLASCSSDRSVNVYEEAHDAARNSKAWRKKSSLVDSRDSVEDVAFAPRHLGLKLATCALDGRVRVYECNDVTDLGVWSLQEEFEASPRDCFCLAWNPSPFDPAMLLVGARGTARVWATDSRREQWFSLAELPGHADDVRGVAWAPSVGRSYHLLATACKDKHVRIYKFWPYGRPADLPSASVSASSSSSSSSSSGAEVELVATLGGHGAAVWRVAWNLTGTVLASTGDDGAVRLWKADFAGQWHPVLVASRGGASSAPTPPASASSFSASLSPFA